VVWIVQNKDFAEALSFWATTAGIGVAFLAGIAAYWRYRKDVQLHEWDRAREAYARFLEIAISNPEFFPGYYTKVAIADPTARNKYVWFIARFLWACEEVLKSCPDSPGVWHSAFKVVIKEHKDYFEAPEGQEEIACYYPPVSALIHEALREAKAEQLLTPMSRKSR
jgi:hypothetical protein